MAAADEVDLTLTVTETSNGFLIEELKSDRLTRVTDCQTLDQVSSLVTRKVFQMPAQLGSAFLVRSAAA